MNSQPISIEKRFLETANAFHGNSHPFHPFPKAVDRKAYEGLPAALKELLIQAGEAKLGYEFPVIRATDYMRFKRDGDRAAFEALYFAKRNALNDLIQAECVEHQGRFLDDILNGIYSICEETAWQLPAHNSYIRDTPQLILPDVTRPVMDLFACETGAGLCGLSAGRRFECGQPFYPDLHRGQSEAPDPAALPDRTFLVDGT